MADARMVLDALGGQQNVLSLEPCITRLRVEVRQHKIIDEDALRSAGAFGVVRAGTTVQVIVGPQADALAQEIGELK